MKLFVIKAETVVHVLDIVKADNEEEAKELVMTKVKRDYNFEPRYSGKGKSYAEVKGTTCHVMGFSTENTADFYVKK